MTAEHSEDSNAPYSETDPTRGEDTSEMKDSIKKQDEDKTESIDVTKTQAETEAISEPEGNIKKENEDNTESNNVTKATETTNETQDSIKMEKEEENILVCGTKEKDSTSQDNVEKDKEDNVTSTCVREDQESELQEKKYHTISKENDDESISPDDLTKENIDNVSSTCVTIDKDHTTPQDNTNIEKEGRVPSEEMIEKSQEEAIQLKDNAVQPESSVQPVEKDAELPFGVTIKTEIEESTKRRSPIEKETVKKYIETEIVSEFPYRYFIVFFMHFLFISSKVATSL